VKQYKSEKEAILGRLNALGVGYCTKEACKKDEMATGMTWEKVLEIPVEFLRSMLEYFDEKEFNVKNN